MENSPKITQNLKLRRERIVGRGLSDGDSMISTNEENSSSESDSTKVSRHR